jgi:long-chain acyl-CoA synthetase
MAINSLADIVRHFGALRPDHVAEHFEGEDITFRQLDERSSRVAQGLRALGVGPQERVAYLGKNLPAFADVCFGAAKLNAVAVPVNWRLAPHEIGFIVDDAEAKVLVVTPEFRPYLDKFDREISSLTKVLIADSAPGDPDSFDAWAAGFDAIDPAVPSAPDDVALQLYTSGTTGLPKGAMLTNRNLLTLFTGAPSHWDFDLDSVNLVAMPLFHIAGSGWLLVGLYSGATNVIHREVDPAAIVKAVPEHRLTNIILVPAVIQMVLNAPGAETTDFSSLRQVTYGAAPITETLLTRALTTMGCGFCQAYGLTETTGSFFSLFPADHDPTGPRSHLLRSVGRPAEWAEVRVVDPDTGEDRPTGEPGEVWMRGATVMRGYWKQPEKTADTITPDGWCKTGDIAYFDDEGYLYLYDRRNDMIVTGGENVYPIEVENALAAHPAVEDVAVIGIPDDRWGETVKAVVVVAPGAGVTEADIIAFARDRLAHYKCPTSVDFIDVLPRNPSGKVLKRQLREPYWAGRGRRIN